MQSYKNEDPDNNQLNKHLELMRRFEGIPPESIYLNTKEAAIFLRCTPKCLERRRVVGLPPSFKKQGSRVLYQLSELIASLEERSNTCREGGK